MSRRCTFFVSFAAETLMIVASACSAQRRTASATQTLLPSDPPKAETFPPDEFIARWTSFLQSLLSCNSEGRWANPVEATRKRANHPILLVKRTPPYDDTESQCESG